MSVVGDLLRDARALLEKGRSPKWDAVDGDDMPVDPIHEDAAKYSVFGALTRAVRDRGDSTGLDAAFVYLGIDNIQDPQGRGLNGLDDEALYKRWDEAVRRADGGPVLERSADQERKMLDPNAEDYPEKLRELRGTEGRREDEPPPVSAPVDEVKTTRKDGEKEPA